MLLTTQYLDEADQLADRITVMGTGTVIAEGTSSELKSRLGGDRVIVTASHGTGPPTALAHLLTGTADEDTREVTIEAGPAGGTAALLAAVRALDRSGLDVDDVLLRRPTLDEVFLHLTDADHRHGRPPMIATLSQGWIVTLRDLKHWVREPWTPIFGIAFSVMLLLVFGFLFGGAIDVPGGGDYLEYLLPGMFALSMLFGVESTMTAIAQDTKRGITDRFRSMPISSVAVPLGRCGADLLNSAVQLLVLMVGGLLVGWRIDDGAGRAMLAVALLLWLRFAVLWIGIYLGVTLRGEGAQMAVQVLVWPLGFLSNLFVAPETMPDWLGFLAQWNPVSATAAAARELFGNPTGITGGVLADHAVLVAFGWPLVLTAIFLPLSARAYRNLSR